MIIIIIIHMIELQIYSSYLQKKITVNLFLDIIEKINHGQILPWNNRAVTVAHAYYGH